MQGIFFFAYPESRKTPSRIDVDKKKGALWHILSLLVTIQLTWVACQISAEM